MSFRFKPEARVKCIKPRGALDADTVYTVKYSYRVDPVTVLVYVDEAPGEAYYEHRFELVTEEPSNSVELTQDELQSLSPMTATSGFTYNNLVSAIATIKKIHEALADGKAVRPPSDPWYQDSFGRWCRRNV